MTVEPASHAKVKLTVDDFDLLALHGGLSGLARTELLDGDIYEMSPQYTSHAMTKARFYNAVLDWQRANRPDLTVLSEASVSIPPSDEPMPDIVLCDHPTGEKGIPVETVHLSIEIAGDTRERDLGYKKAIYARGGVSEYWVVDLRDRQVHVFSKPKDEGYREASVVAFGDAVVAVMLAGLVVETESST